MANQTQQVTVAQNDQTALEQVQQRTWRPTRINMSLLGIVGGTSAVIDLATNSGVGGAILGLGATWAAVTYGDDVVRAVLRVLPPEVLLALKQGAVNLWPFQEAQPKDGTIQVQVSQVDAAEEDKQESAEALEQPQAAYPTNPGIKAPPQTVAALPSQQVLAQQSAKPDTAAEEDVQESPMVSWDMGTGAQPPVRARKPGDVFRFRELVDAGFKPTPDKIFIGRVKGKDIFVKASELCHIAIAGKTEGGKDSLLRVLLAQLCYIGADILLLNPHFQRYVRARTGKAFDEDWTPFEGINPRTGNPYLRVPPTECAEIAAIARELESAYEELEERIRAARYEAQMFRPLFVALNEWPSIVKKMQKYVPTCDAPEILSFLLREGRKYGIYVILSSQDFLVKTIGTDGGSVRKCLQVVYYTGGDATTARELLNEPGKTFDENTLGKGNVAMRWGKHEATLSEQPFGDNEAIYALLGKSTYEKPIPGQAVVQVQMQAPVPLSTKGMAAGSMLDDLYQKFQAGIISQQEFLDAIMGKANQFDAEAGDDNLTGVVPPRLPDVDELPVRTRKRPSSALPPELQYAYNEYEDYMSWAKFGIKLGVSKATAGGLLQRLRDKGAVDRAGKKLLG